MYYYSIFQQLFKFIPRYRFDKKAEETAGNRYCKHISAWRQFLTCLYAQITGKDSLREIASGLATNQSRLYHLGMKAVAKSTFADAMNRRSPEIFEALFGEILDRAIACAPGHGFKFHNPFLRSGVHKVHQQDRDFPHGDHHSHPRRPHDELRPDGSPAVGQKNDSQASRLEPPPTNGTFRRFPMLKFLPDSSDEKKHSVKPFTAGVLRKTTKPRHCRPFCL